MAKKLKPGNSINGYEVTEFLNQGALAISYAAKSPSGEKVFLKQYKSPSAGLEWYKAYVDYQAELKRRIESSAAKRFCYRMVEFFEAVWGHDCYFQVFEFVEEGHDLEQILEKIRENPSAFSFEQRLTFAKVIMASINALHGAGVIHCDLKPANIQLFKDDSIGAGYVVKLIDFDYSILHDQPAPWHGIQGYVGSPGYFSPEHLTPGASPVAASDVFTCGLILCELLGEMHPYRFETPDEYQKAALEYRAGRPKLIGTLPAPASNETVTAMLHRCLSPDSMGRPSARDVNLVLNGREPEGDSAPAPTAATPPVTTPPVADPPAPKPSAPPKAVATATTLTLVSESGKTVQMSVRTSVSKHLLQSLGEDAIYYDGQEQFCLDKAGEGWVAKHNSHAKHQTLLNGKSITEPTPVSDGDVLAVGSEEREIQKLPVTVRLS